MPELEDRKTIECKCGKKVVNREYWSNRCLHCGREYNGAGQMLRYDWRNNPSLYNDDIGDMEGYEMSQGDS